MAGSMADPRAQHRALRLDPGHGSACPHLHHGCRRSSESYKPTLGLMGEERLPHSVTVGDEAQGRAWRRRGRLGGPARVFRPCQLGLFIPGQRGVDAGADALDCLSDQC